MTSSVKNELVLELVSRVLASARERGLADDGILSICVVTGRVLVPPPQNVGAPPPPLTGRSASQKVMHIMFRIVDIARVFILRPANMLMYS